MPREELINPAAVAPASRAAVRAPYWRAVLEARWRARLHEVTRLSLAYHGAAAAAPDGRVAAGQHEVDRLLDAVAAGQHEVERLLDATVAARRKLADTEEALARLAAGSFGRCEQCGAAIPAGLLTVLPETRYCARCDAPALPQPPAEAARRPASR
jgi:RNA polymerase-binding transcription factor DksA